MQVEPWHWAQPSDYLANALRSSPQFAGPGIFLLEGCLSSLTYMSVEPKSLADYVLLMAILHFWFHLQVQEPHQDNSWQQLPSFIGNTSLKDWSKSNLDRSSSSLTFSQSFPSLPSSLSWLLSLGLFNHATLRQYLPIGASTLSPQLPKNLISSFHAVPWSSVSFFLLERGDGFGLSILSSMLKTNHLMSRERPGFADYR